MPVEKKDRPDITLEVQDEKVKVSWGPQKGLWGIFREGADPVNVEIEEWVLYVGTSVHKLKPEQGTEGSKPIFADNVGKKGEMTIPINKPSLNKKTVVAQVIGIFESKNENGEKFKEGIYSDVAQKEID